MPITYEPIATSTASGSATSITFSSIPSTYTDLVLVADVLGAASGTDPVLRFNSDTSANYSSTNMRGDGSSASSVRYSEFYIVAGASWNSGVRYIHTINIQNYANTTTYKTVLVRSSDPGNSVSAIVGLWRATPAAINSVQISASANITAGSTFTLYGIKAA
jgi:hypothetical protein